MRTCRWLTAVSVLVLGTLAGCNPAARNEAPPGRASPAPPAPSPATPAPTSAGMATEVDKHLAVAREYVEKREFDLALVEYTVALTLDSERADAYYERGKVHEGMTLASEEHLELAVADFDKAAQLAPDNVEYLVRRARNLLDRSMRTREDKPDSSARDRKQAAADLDRALTLEPGRADIYLVRASLRYDRQDYQGAVEDYTKAIELDPKNAEAYSGRSTAYEGLGEKDRARADLDKAEALGLEYE